MSLFSVANNIALEKRANFPVGSLTGPTHWLSTMFGGQSTRAGIRVSEENAISLSTVFNAITLLSETVAQLPLSPYIKKDGQRRQYTEHYSYPLVHFSPNQFMRSYTWRKLMVNYVCRWGNAYAPIERSNYGRPVALYPVHPSRVSIKIDEDHNLWYFVDGGKMVFSSTDMFHVMGFTDDGLVGRSNIDIARESIAQSMAVERFGSDFFGKGITISGYIKHPRRLKDEKSIKRLKESFVQAHGGPNNQFGVGLLEDGADWIKNEVDPEKAQALDVRKFNVEEIARWLNVPVPLLKSLERATFNNVEQLDIQFAKYTIVPWTVNFEQEYAEKLLMENEKDGSVYFKHNMNGLLRGDMSSRGQFYERMQRTGAFSPNDIRELEDMNPYEGGDVHVINPGAQTIEQLQNN